LQGQLCRIRVYAGTRNIHVVFPSAPGRIVCGGAGHIDGKGMLAKGLQCSLEHMCVCNPGVCPGNTSPLRPCFGRDRGDNSVNARVDAAMMEGSRTRDAAEVGR
jgi:hypothetical protein